MYERETAVSTNVELGEQQAPGAVPAGLHPFGALPAWLEAAAQPDRAQLTPRRSIAADPRLVAPGAMAYVATTSVHRFVVSQDAGAAITGARADLFLGAGTDAEVRAGSMRERGVLYVFVPR